MNKEKSKNVIVKTLIKITPIILNVLDYIQQFLTLYSRTYIRPVLPSLSSMWKKNKNMTKKNGDVNEAEMSIEKGCILRVAECVTKKTA